MHRINFIVKRQISPAIEIIVSVTRDPEIPIFAKAYPPPTDQLLGKALNLHFPTVSRLQYACRRQYQAKSNA